MAYQTRVQLAVMDYNSHLSQEKAKNKDGIQIHNRKFRKQTKKWDATPVLECKKYPHIPDLMKEIEVEYKDHDTALRVQVQSSYNNPSSIQKTIGNSQPETTSEIVQKNVLDFDKNNSANTSSSNYFKTLCNMVHLWKYTARCMCL